MTLVRPRGPRLQHEARDHRSRWQERGLKLSDAGHTMPEPKPVLEIGSIYGALFSRGDGKFHWALVVPLESDTGQDAVKMHATNLGTGVWRYVREPDKSPNLCVVVKLGETSPLQNMVDYIDDLLKNIPMLVPEEDMIMEDTFTCRVWFKEAVRVLAANGIVKCLDVHSLEKEMFEYGEENDIQTGLGYPYKAHASQYCT
ncbi:hypothetical protein EVG20_g669 [Dentipellis fragilis]|uniref:Uncharacterized protein n=1 Tax=Dentipellis fragilis TaxID=205917 RepID=A0A4Y9ZBX7_9AGAM|nr:hypothetical protein EVG20_g669 [Dentipellis fragilis]